MLKERLKFSAFVLGIVISGLMFIECYTVEQNVLGRYKTTVSYFNEDAVQEVHTAKIVIDGVLTDVNVLSDFEQFHTEDTDIIVTIKKGRLTGFVFSYKATNKNTKKFREIIKNKF